MKASYSNQKERMANMQAEALRQTKQAQQA